jgi:N-acetylglucosamine kinase-like BadF-type ATPase
VNRASALFGIDGGGTSTRLRIADLDNRALWEGRGEGINPNALERGELGARLSSLFAEGLSATGLGAADFAAGCLGVAGADRPEEKAELEALLRGGIGLDCPLEILADADIALAGGLRNEEGIILIAGTGSIAVARLADGGRVRAGGYGHFLSDEGSAFFIGFQAIRRSLRSMEGRDLPTSMLPALLGHFGLEEPGRFVPMVYRSFDKAAIAGAALLVAGAARQGDSLAAAILAEARDELVGLVSSVHRRVDSRIRNRALVLWGGLFEHLPGLKAEVTALIARRHPDLSLTDAAESAAYGACLIAARLAGGSAPLT